MGYLFMYEVWEARQIHLEERRKAQRAEYEEWLYEDLGLHEGLDVGEGSDA